MSSINTFTNIETSSIFSDARLNKLKDSYSLNDKNTLLLHAQLGQLNGAIHASISLFEIHLRNLIICCLDEIYGDDWLFSAPVMQAPNTKRMIKGAKKSAQKNKFSKLPYQDRKAIKAQFSSEPEEQRKIEARKTMVVDKDDIIPHLYFSFWRSMFSKPHEPLLWNKGLRKVFPLKTIKRGMVSDYLETCHKTRNRVSHNEFIHPYLCHRYIEAITFLTQNLAFESQVGSNKVYQFHAPYIEKIKLQLLELEHFLQICR